MGTVDVRRDEVEEWLLPVPFTTIGDALVIVSSFWTATVTVLGSASAVFTAEAPTIVSVLAEATVAPFGSVFAQPLMLASAVVGFDNTGSSVKDVALVPAVAVIAVTAPADLVVGISGVAGVSLAPSGPVSVQVTGDAEVEFAYYGNGNYPVFPYNLPVLFTDNLQNIQDAAALVRPTGVGLVDAVAGSAEAVLPTMTGEALLTLKGSTPIFPAIFPLVFDDLPANMNVALARLLLNMNSESIVVLVGESTVVIDAQASSLPSAVFPWVFPVILLEAA